VPAGNLLNAIYEARDPDSLAFCEAATQRRVKTAEWRVHVGAYAAALAEIGIGLESRVSIRLGKFLDTIALAHACLQVGAILQPINTAYTDTETRHILEDVEPDLVVCEEREREALQRLAAGRHVETLGAGGSGTLGERARRCHPRQEIADVRGDAVAAILYTSGTTGKPKGAQITHANLATSACALARVWELGSADRLLHFLPVYHAHGLLTSINVMLVGGGAVVLLEKFDAAETLDALPRTTMLMAVPTHYGRLLREPRLDGALDGSFRLAISGSAPLSLEVAREFERRTGHAIIERYGSTEAAIITAVPARERGRAGWVGWALPGVEIRVAGDDGTRASRSAVGVLETRGENVFRGYWRRPDADAEAFTADGWFITGDIAEIDATGCVRLLGRARDLIISGGLNIYPQEVEAAIEALPGVSESAVFGVPHPDFGEACVAAVRLQAGAVLDESPAIRALRERLAGYKVPKKLIALAELPRNGNGKVLKTHLRETYRDLFAGGSH
jgi:malonyl-CoA/methylmalonyl-CoA synthetase